MSEGDRIERWFDPVRVRAVRGVREVAVLDAVDSTQDELRRRLEAGRAGPGDVVVARGQTHGRGRRGRTWYSPPGVGLYLSVLLAPRGPAGRVPRWTLAAAVAACEACREACGDGPTVSWPNDVVVGERKLAGILAELRSGPDGSNRMILGLGVNLRAGPEPVPDDLADRVTSLAETGSAIMDPARVAAGFLERLFGLGALLDRDAWSAVAERWVRLAPDAFGARVRTASGAGTTAGIDEDGALRVVLDDGRTVRFHSVDAAPRGDGANR